MRSSIKITLTQSYIIAFSLLAMWAFFAYETMNSQIREEKKYAELINISGKQRMLSQRTSLLAHLYIETADPRHLDALNESRVTMEAEHRYLMAHLPSETMRRFYEEAPERLDESVRGYLALLERFVGSSQIHLVDGIFDASSALLPVLDRAVKAYEQESDAVTNRLMRVEFYILMGTLLTLLLEALFIIRPVLRRATWNLRELDRRVHEQTEQLSIYKKLVESANEAIIITGPDNRIVSVNPAFTEITGYTPEEGIGRNPSLLKSGQQDRRFYERFWAQLNTTGSWHGEFVNRRKDGGYYYQFSHVFLLRDATGAVNHHVMIFSDISQIRESQEQLEFMAMHDPLTQLPNRAYLMDQMEHAMERAARSGERVAAILLDLDDFKTVNDSLTHRVGDLLLQHVGRTLREHTRRTDTVARIGGDEFVLLVEQLKSGEELIILLEKIQQQLAVPFEVDGYLLNLSCSLGVALYPDDADSGDRLLQFADTAMYNAKKLGKNQFGFFTEELNTAIRHKLEIENELKQAVDNGEFSLVFQPIVRLEEERTVGFETLLRWNSGRFGMVPPDHFIPIAESTGFIGMIDNWVLCQMQEVLADRALDGYYFTVNISSKQFSQRNFMHKLLECFKETEVRDRMVIEVTETAIIDNINHTKSVLSGLKDRGFRIAIDDFGTGYSSLYYLKHLPLDYIKIDKSFVMDMEHDENDRIITDSIISMSRQLNLLVVAEGVETQAQMRYLQSRSCHLGQGYHFAKPLTLDEAKIHCKRGA